VMVAEVAKTFGDSPCVTKLLASSATQNATDADARIWIYW
jgi:hypothetical protein